MTDLIAAAAIEAVTMTSLEIAELVGARHDNVKRAIDRMVARAVIDQPARAVGPKSGNQVAVQVYVLNRLDSIAVVARLSPEFTVALVKRWDELETHGRESDRILIANLQRQLDPKPKVWYTVDDIARLLHRKATSGLHENAQIVRGTLKQAGLHDFYRGGRRGERLEFTKEGALVVAAMIGRRAMISTFGEDLADADAGRLSLYLSKRAASQSDLPTALPAPSSTNLQ